MLVISVVLFFAAYAIEFPGTKRFGGLLWVVWVLGVVFVGRRQNRATPPAAETRAMLLTLALLLGVSAALAALFSGLVGGVFGGVSGATMGAWGVWRERRR